MNKNLCYVTSYLEINRKFWLQYDKDFDSYLASFKNFIKLFSDKNNKDIEMLVFIDILYYKIILNLCKELPIHVIPIDKTWLSINSRIWKRKEKIKQNISENFYKNFINHRLYDQRCLNSDYNTIINCKLDFMKYATYISSAKYFYWINFGYFGKNSKIIMQTKRIENLKNINYCLLKPIELNSINVHNFLTNNDNILSSRAFICDRNIINGYLDIYVNVMDDVLKNKIVLSDEYIVLLCYLRYSELFNMKLMKNIYYEIVNF